MDTIKKTHSNPNRTSEFLCMDSRFLDHCKFRINADHLAIFAYVRILSFNESFFVGQADTLITRMAGNKTANDSRLKSSIIIIFSKRTFCRSANGLKP